MQLLKTVIEDFFDSRDDTFFDRRTISVTSLTRKSKILDVSININANFFTVEVKCDETDAYDKLLKEAIKHVLTNTIMENAFKRNLIISELKYNFDLIENAEIISGLERNIPITFN